MLKDRSELEQQLIKYSANNATHQIGLSTTQQWYLDLQEKYNIPITISSDIISQRKDISQFNEFILFAITDILKPEWIKKYFTEQEIKLYSGKKIYRK